MRHTPNPARPITRLVAVSLFVALLSVAGVPLFDVAAAPLEATSPTLGAAASYSVLASATVTNTGPTTVPGDLGVSPGSAVTGFPDGIVGPPGIIHAGDAHAATAQSANITAFNNLDQPCDSTYPGAKDLVGEDLVPGVYCAVSFQLSGTLTLSGSGVWIFKSASDLTTSGTANVVGGNPCDVWWRTVSSATLGTNTSLKGNVLAQASITLQSGASVTGRVLAQTGAVTLDTNTFTSPPCAAAATPVPTATDTPAPVATSTPVPVATNTLVPVATNTPVLGATDIPVPVATNTPVLGATGTPVPAATDTPVPAATNTPVPRRQRTPVPTPPDTLVPTPPDITVTPPDITVTPPDITVTPPDVTVTPPDVTVTPPNTLVPPPPDITVTPPLIRRLPPTGSSPRSGEDFLLAVVLATWILGAIALGLSRRMR